MSRETWARRGQRLRHVYLVALILGGLLWWARYAEWAWMRLVTEPLGVEETYGPAHSALRLVRCFWDPDRWSRGEHVTSGLWGFTWQHLPPRGQTVAGWNVFFALLIAPGLVAAVGLFVGTRHQSDELPANRRCRPAALIAASVMGGACITAAALHAMNNTHLTILFKQSRPVTPMLIFIGFAAAAAGFAAVAWRYIVARDGYWRLERISRLVLVLGALTWAASWIKTPGSLFGWRSSRHPAYQIDIPETVCFTGATAMLWAGAVRLILLWRIERYRVRRQEVIAVEPYCLDCGYDLRGSLAPRASDENAPPRTAACPECGTAVPSEVVRIFRKAHPAQPD